MKDKNIYEALHDMNSSIDEYEKMEVSDIEKAKMEKAFMTSIRKSKFNLKKIGLIAAALALAVILFGQTEFGGNVYANVVNTLSDVASSILGGERPEGNNDRYAENYDVFAELKPYLCDVNMTAEDNGIEVKLTDVLISEDRLAFNTIFAEDGKQLNAPTFDYDVYVDDKLMELENKHGRGIYSDDGTMSQNSIARISGIDTTSDLDIKIKINKVQIRDGSNEFINGDWTFDFRANGKKLAADSIVKEIDKKIEKDGKIVDFKKLVYNPLDKVIYAEISNYDGIYDSFKLCGQDDLGNDFTIGISQWSSSNNLAYFENAGGDNSIEIGKGAKQLKLTLYYARYPESEVGEVVEDPEFEKIGEEFTVNLE